MSKNNFVHFLLIYLIVLRVTYDSRFSNQIPLKYHKETFTSFLWVILAMIKGKIDKIVAFWESLQEIFIYIYFIILNWLVFHQFVSTCREGGYFQIRAHSKGGLFQY
jgi:hypothetical protein